MKIEIRRNADGTLDEIVAGDPKELFVHLEQMDDYHWWIGLTENGKTTHVHFRLIGDKIDAKVIEDA